MAASGEVTQLLVDYGAGNRGALDELLPLVYDELRRIAANYVNRERREHTLQPTALVHEAYLRLVNQHSVDWRNRAQFYGLAAEMMRRILVNHAEKKLAEKRGSGGKQVSIDDTVVITDELNLDLLALDEALNSLAELDEDKAKLVEMKFFGGMTIQEIAEVTGRSTATIEREWAFARGWLLKTLTERK
ncbi:MAG: sigma-70 family RNA polymerase sigma factor [Pyrinomonadaceae bacterium]